jgi:hypothetical protein
MSAARVFARGAVWALAAALCAGCAPPPPPPAAPTKKYEAPDERYVFFNLGKVEVQYADGYFSIGYVVALLDAEPAYHVLVVGHADPHGKPDVNHELSFKRARAVRKVLMDHGVKENRILLAAPNESGSTDEKLSRRVDLYVYDPVQDEVSKRLGYKVDIKAE